MPALCIRHTELPGTTKLFADFLYHFDRVKPFYRYAPLDAESFAAAAREIRFPPERRAALVEALRGANPGNPSLTLLGQPGAVVVVTGQQVGLYSGPAYTLYKAFTAVKLAAELRDAGMQAVPVFWLATEDHDFDEVRVSWAFGADGQPRAFALDPARASGGPVGAIPIPEYPHPALRAALKEFPFGDEVADLAAACYQPGATLGDGFRALLGKLTEGRGLLLVDPLDPAIRALARPALEAAVEAAEDLSAGLLERNRALAAAGYHAQVHIEEHTSLFFLLENGRRIALKRSGGHYFAGARKISPQELRGMNLSPNALLRPVMQDFILPSAAYVGGPAELAYLAQAEVLYRGILGRMPVVLPRAAFTLTDFRAHKLLERYRLELADFFHGLDALRDRMARTLTPPALAAAADRTHRGVTQAIAELANALEAFDPTLGAALAKSRQKILYQLSKIEGKIRRESLHRDGRAGADAAWLNGLLFPHKHLQERTYSILPFLAKHGWDALGEIYDSIETACPDHRLLQL